jgi:hypothetical protein
MFDHLKNIIFFKELHEKVARGHFAIDIIAKKILDVGY